MELKDYSSEELREELKRRAKEARKNAVREKPKYIEIEGEVIYIRQEYGTKSFIWTNFTVKTNDERVSSHDKIRTYRVKNGCFKKNTIPKIGDIVIIGHLLTKAKKNFNPYYAKIIRVVKRKEE